MRRIFFIFLTALMCLFCTIDQADARKYKAGSVGDIYQECRVALEQSQSLRAGYETRCGAFVEGYFMGVLTANKAGLPPVDKKDPCYNDKVREFDRINNRVCKNLPIYNPKAIVAQSIFSMAGGIVERWVEQNSKYLNAPVTTSIGSLSQPGAFCESLKDDTALPQTPVSGALLNLQWSDIMDIKNFTSYDKKFEQCDADLKAANKSSSAFRKTRCGAEIMGFIAGLHSTDHLQKRDDVSYENPSCKKQMDRLYRGFDVNETMCLKANTNPMLVAKIFVQNYKFIRGLKQEPGMFAALNWMDLGALGYVGRSTIYHGFLCRNETAQ